MSRHRHRPRKPFDWLGERMHRRGALQSDPPGRSRGVAFDAPREKRPTRPAGCDVWTGLLDIEPMPTPEFISLCPDVPGDRLEATKERELAALQANRPEVRPTTGHERDRFLSRTFRKRGVNRLLLPCSEGFSSRFPRVFGRRFRLPVGSWLVAPQGCPPDPPFIIVGFFSERSGRHPRRKSRFRVSGAATWPL